MSAPEFVTRDPAGVVAALVAQYETETGRTLYPAQVERLLINLVAYRESLTRELIQDTAVQNLVSFARRPYLDALGELMGVARLAPSPAWTTARMTFAAPLGAAAVLPAGWRAALPSGLVLATTAQRVIAAGSVSVEFMAVSQSAGTGTNGWPAGMLTAVDAPPAPLASLVTLAPTHDGADEEDDERLRARIKLAPEVYSWGSANRYRALALAAAPSLRDVRVWSPRPDGSITVVLLGAEGIPGSETVAQVQAALDAPDRRMLGDRITVVAATPVDYALQVSVDVRPDAVVDLVLQDVERRLQAWADAQAQTLGIDLVPARIVAAGAAAVGVYDLRVIAPAQRVLQAHEWPRLTALTVTLGVQVPNA